MHELMTTVTIMGATCLSGLFLCAEKQRNQRFRGFNGTIIQAIIYMSNPGNPAEKMEIRT